MAAPPLRGVVAGHGALPDALIQATEAISGITGALVPVSNADCSRPDLEARIVAAVGDGPALVFIDLASGSCMFAALRRLRERPDVRVVTGVNLAMLLDFVFNRAVPAAQGAERALAAGGSAIGSPA